MGAELCQFSWKQRSLINFSWTLPCCHDSIIQPRWICFPEYNCLISNKVFVRQSQGSCAVLQFNNYFISLGTVTRKRQVLKIISNFQCYKLHGVRFYQIPNYNLFFHLAKSFHPMPCWTCVHVQPSRDSSINSYLC